MPNTKVCPDCKAEIADASRFCPQCGVPQALNCAACGHSNAAGSRFCAQCGAKLGGAAPVTIPAPDVAPSSPASPSSSAERRQLTVMFCDLVGSTALSTRLDPEDLREVIAAYHKRVADVAARFEGFIAKYMGDGVLIYFGYPKASETDADNAVRAALAAVEAVGELTTNGNKHQVRIGIATGLVVVGELIGEGSAQERNVVGETPNLAARLQSIAGPNAVVIDAGTRRLTGDLFAYEPIEASNLKGFEAPVTAWRVLREQTMHSRFEALRAGNLVPLVGREEELELLLRRWQQAKSGEGRVVLLSGEPGIGKSRLTAALVERISSENPTYLRYFCLPHHQGSALQPVVAHLSQAAGFTRDDTPAVKRVKIEEVMAQGGRHLAAAAELLSDLLGFDARPDRAAMDPQRKRSQLHNALLDQLQGVAQRGPILMLFEDAHWSDPTTLELFSLAIERIQTLPILLVVTHRPDFQPPWIGQHHVTAVALNRLGRRDRMALVDHVTGGKTLPQSVLDQIVDRTDGVPLFIEELTKTVLESEHIHEDSDRYVLEQPMQPLAIPTTLQGSLMARVDRLGSAREVLQIGAAIGREFSHELIAAVAGLADPVLQDALARLTESGLLIMRGRPPDATYAFKHALVQDTAYSTMLRTRRQALHGAIAQVIEKRSPDIVASTPEVLAQQFEGAGRTDQAIHYWRLAGDRDLRRFAMKEGIAHFHNALRLAATLPDSPARAAHELGISLGLGLATQISLGPTSQECGDHYTRAFALSQNLPDRGRERFLAGWGVWFYKTMTTQTEEARRSAEDLVAIAHELDNPDLQLEAYHARLPGLLWLPDFAALKESSEEVIRLYDRERHREHAYYFGGHDSRVCAMGFQAISLWALGFLDQAQQTSLACAADARDLGHTFSIAHGLNWGGLPHLLLKDVDACRVVTDELYPIAERNKFPWPLTYARFQRGWLLAQESDRSAGIEQMLASVGAPSIPMRSIVLTMVAEQQLLAGRVDDAAATLEQAVDTMNVQHIYFYLAEATRLQGELMLMQSRSNIAAAEQVLREAVAIGAQQSCHPLQLRAATSLATLLAGENREAEAKQALAPVYAGFTEGFALPDLRAAKAVLDQLA